MNVSSASVRARPQDARSLRHAWQRGLEFVGVVSRRPDTSSGWHRTQPDELALLRPLYEVDAEPSTEDATEVVSECRMEHDG